MIKLALFVVILSDFSASSRIFNNLKCKPILIRYTCTNEPANVSPEDRLSSELLPNQIIAFDIKNVRLNRFPSVVFKDYPQVYRLIFANCSIRMLEGFDDLPTSNLTQLILSGNNFTNVGESFLKGPTPNLQELNLARNFIYDIHENAFRNLTSNRTSIDLSYNRLERFAKNVFRNVRGLRMLFLSHNSLKDIEGVFNDLITLEHLELERNKLQVITMKTFEGTNSLKILDIGYNQIHTVPAEAFIEFTQQPFLFIMTGNNLTRPEYDIVLQRWQSNVLI